MYIVHNFYHYHITFWLFLLKYEEWDYYLVINKDFAVRRIGISFHITNNINKQLDLFSDIDDNEKEYSLLRNVSKIKNKYGKNSILRGISYTENANQLSRNKYVGGHNAE